jgi:outer membrane protein assembly factor BamB/tetratricopeptide (TPR) repeat protein
MSWSLRRVRLVLAAVTLLAWAAFVQHGWTQERIKVAEKAAAIELPVVSAPDNPSPREAFDFAGLSLPKDEKGLKDKIKAAVDYIDEKNWAIAIPHLQKIVDLPADVFVKLPRKTPDGRESFSWVSARTEANRLIAGLPKAGLEFYKLTYGTEALTLLKKAKASGDPTLLAEVMKRFAHTDAGAEAIVLLARYQLDRGNSVPADLCFKKLLGREGADKLAPTVLYYMAIAAHLAGDREGEKLAWERLKANNREVPFGNETRSISELQEYVSGLQNSAVTQDASDSLVFRATQSRSNQLSGGPAFMEARWKQPMIHADTTGPTAQRISQAEKLMQNRNIPLLPAFFPVTATVTKDGVRKPLLIYKSFWGVHAIDMRTGKLDWDAPSDWSLERMLAGRDPRKLNAINNWLQMYLDSQQRPQILFENSICGTVSTDDEFAYVIEDFLVPPTPQNAVAMGFAPGAGGPGNGYSQEITDATQHNHLQAYDLHHGGKLSWVLGSFGDKDELSDSFFLGPPLPLGGKLYVLTEKQQELHLVCLNPHDHTPEGHPRASVQSVQTLATAEEKFQNDVFNRRSQAVHLAYGEGILVVPTNTGAVFGINLLENSLVWAYPYREKDDAPPADGVNGAFPPGVRGRIRGAPGVMVGPDGRPILPQAHQAQWKTSAPAIHDGKVVFTAPDARSSLHCINLRDGTRAWAQKPNPDDLYFAGIYSGKVLIVGKKKCRALNLSTGETMWELDTGSPSGQGVASGKLYFLPLREAAGTNKDPEICAIDVDKGAIVAHTRSRKKEIPGNLLFYEGDVLSQSHTEVVAYPQLKVKIAQMDELIAKNPNDPRGLSERGDYRLDQGDLPGAIEDLRQALNHKPPDDLRARIRGKLYEALTEYVHWKFNDAEQYLKEYEDVCKVDVAGADDAQRASLLAEERRRRTTFLCLVAEGRKSQGRLVEAFEKYQQFAEVARTDELTSSVDERGVRANPDVWARGRIAAMVAGASIEQRKPLEDLIAARWEKLQSGASTIDELRQFVRLFGTLSPAGKEARFRLVDRLIEVNEPGTLLEAEKELLLLRSPREAPEVAARAIEALGRLYTRRGLLEDAGYCYRVLGRDFAHIKVRDGRTGADLYDEAATDKRLMPHLDEARLGPIGRIKAVSEGGAPPTFPTLYRFEHIGESLPYFRHFDVALTHTGNKERFVLLDPRTGQEHWGKELTATHFMGLPHGNGPPNAPRFPYRSLGHLVVMPAGHMVFGIDPVGQQVLWEKNLASGANPAAPGGAPWQSFTIDPRDGSLLLLYPDGFAQRIGQAGSLEGSVLCVQTRDALEALDPLTGKTLWMRTDVAPRATLFADDQYVFVVETNSDGMPTSTRVLRAADGVSVKAPGFAALYSKRLRTLGRNLLLSETGPNGAVTLRLYDVPEGKDLWAQAFAPRSQVLQSENPGLTGVVEPDGKVHVLDSHTGKAVLVTDKGYDYTNPKTGMDPAHLANLQDIGLVADGERIFVACNTTPDPNVTRFGPLQSHLMANQGMRALPVNGMIYAYDRSSGEFKWNLPAPNQTITLERFAEVPVLMLTSHHSKMINVGAGRGFAGVQQVVSVQSIDKRNGKTVFTFKEEGNNSLNPFHTLKIDTRAGKVELIGMNKTIVHLLFGEVAVGKMGAGQAQPGLGRPDGVRTATKTGALPAQVSDIMIGD